MRERERERERLVVVAAESCFTASRKVGALAVESAVIQSVQSCLCPLQHGGGERESLR